ncbi:MAG: hypothetical protein K6E19_06125 [Lachnospiraceae bacterium]|nr:hypothetical protein [Lachnospiraceae bacterium]
MAKKNKKLTAFLLLGAAVCGAYCYLKSKDTKIPDNMEDADPDADYTEDSAEKEYSTKRPYVSLDYKAVEQKVQDVASKVEDTATKAAGQLGDFINKAAGKVEEFLDDHKDQVKETVENAADKVEEAAEKAEEKVEEAAKKIDIE